MLQLFPKIQQAFEAKKTLFINNNVPHVQFVDVYMGQPLNPEEFEFVLPAVFIDYRIDYEVGQIYIDAHILVEFGEDTASPFQNKLTGLEYMKMIAICKHIITGLKTSYIDRLKPAAQRPETTEFYHYHILSFTAEIRNYTDNDIIPPQFTDAAGITAVIDKTQLVQTAKVQDIPSLDVFNK